MRDLQHLEELSAATGFGSWANDVVLALDRVEHGAAIEETDRIVLGQAADLLEALAEPQRGPRRPDSAKGLAASETTRSALAAVLKGRDREDQAAALRELAAVAKEAASGGLPVERKGSLEYLIRIFDRVGDLQLVRSTTVLASRKNGIAWTAMRLT